MSIFELKSGEDLIGKIIENTAVMITLVSFLFMISGCSYYKPVIRVNEGTDDLLGETINKLYSHSTYPRELYPVSNLQKLFFIDYKVFVVDSTRKWQLAEAELIRDTIYAEAELVPVSSDSKKDMPQNGQSVRYIRSQDSDLLKRVFIYTDKMLFNQDGKAYFSGNDISKIVVFKNDPSKKVAVIIIILAGIVAVNVGLLISGSFD